MSDYNSSLPIRTENAGDAIVKIADATIPAQQLAVEADGSINVNAAFAPGTEVKITDGTDTLEVNADGSLNVIATATDLDIRDLAFATDSVDVSGSSVTVSATDLDIRDLDSAQDSVEVLQATHDNLNLNANLQVGDADVANGNPVPVSDAGGSLTVDASDLDIRDLAFATDKIDASGSTVALDAPTLAALESITVQNGAGAAAVNIQDGGNSLTVDATDLDVRDLTHVSDSVKIGDGSDFLAVNTDGSINVVVSNDIPGTEICNYQTSSAVASNASVNHDYTVTALNAFTGEQIVVSGSGKLKAEVLFNGVTKFVTFNSTSEPNIVIPLLRTIKAAAGQVIRITITNRDNQAQDLYSTLMGVENL